ncbi:MAG: hypothetical protein U5R49_04630 [Deltaproteobacteria bacterium]|nr:hypothetical protein [Deltaproteobacteria bacterium]
MTYNRTTDPPARTKRADSLLRSHAPAFLTLIAALFLSVEFGLQKTGHGGLCPTTGCALVGSFVRYGEITFIGLGVVFFWLLTALLLLEKRPKKPRLWMVATIILIAGLAFDGAILGFKRFAIQEICILCYGVGASLLVTLLAYGWSRRSLATVVLGVAVWSAGFASQAMLAFPERTPDLSETVMTTFRPAQPDGRQIFFFFSLHCDKCNGVMASLTAHPPLGGEWRLIPLGYGGGRPAQAFLAFGTPPCGGRSFQRNPGVEERARAGCGDCAKGCGGAG